MTGLAWGLAYANGVGRTIQIAFVFVLGHFLLTSLLVSTLMFFLVGRVLGKRRQGLFGPSPAGAGEEGLEFGYCFDVRTPAVLTPLLLTMHCVSWYKANVLGDNRSLSAPTSLYGPSSTSSSSCLCPSSRRTTGCRTSSETQCTSWRCRITS